MILVAQEAAASQEFEDTFLEEVTTNRELNNREMLAKEVAKGRKVEVGKDILFSETYIAYGCGNEGAMHRAQLGISK